MEIEMLLKNKIKTLILTVLVLGTVEVSAAQNNKECRNCYTPAQVSLVAPVQTSPTTCDVNGVRLNLIHGKNRNVRGVDVGIVNQTTENMKGLEVGIVNIVGGDLHGVQDGIVNSCKNVRGVQTGLVNVCHCKCAGVQRGLLYNKCAHMKGFQWGGVVNQARRVQGLQLGLINVTHDLNGAQLGLINVQTSRKCFKVLPILNFSNSGGKGKRCAKYRSCRAA